ncbi:MAG: hypothetical protein IAG10_02945 [Planctomycetaceae bacterium]|nr:hypothetical protein [Planctomycetaceae bacterium]
MTQGRWHAAESGSKNWPNGWLGPFLRAQATQFRQKKQTLLKECFSRPTTRLRVVLVSQE